MLRRYTLGDAVLQQPDTMIDGFSRATHLLRAGLCADALTQFGAVYADANASGHIELMAACLCEMGWAGYKLGKSELALEFAMAARRLREKQDRPVELARALSVEAIIFLDMGFSDEAFELSERALAMAETAGDPAVLAFALNAKGNVLAICRETEIGMVLVSRAIALSVEQANIAAEAYYLSNLGFCHAKLAEEAALLGNPAQAHVERETAIALSATAIARAEACGDNWTLRVALGNTAELQGIEARFDIAMACLDRMAEIPGDPGASLRIHYLYTLASVLQRSGDLYPALAAITDAQTLADVSGQIDHQVNVLAKAAEIYEDLGDTALALAAFKRFHGLYVAQSGESARRRVRIEEIRSETLLLRSQAATLTDLALSDPLTGIANRRSFDLILNRLAGTPISLAIVDLDHFKLVNDQFSHIVGDAVLQRVAKLMVAQIGPHGHAARLGGEEFVLVFPDAPEATAAAFCEGIRFAIAGAEWEDLAPGLAVTASFGLASGDGTTPSGDLMQEADTRLYLAKSNGRDRVVSSDALIVLPAPSTPEERRRWRA